MLQKHYTGLGLEYADLPKKSSVPSARSRVCWQLFLSYAENKLVTITHTVRHCLSTLKEWASYLSGSGLLHLWTSYWVFRSSLRIFGPPGLWRTLASVSQTYALSVGHRGWESARLKAATYTLQTDINVCSGIRRSNHSFCAREDSSIRTAFCNCW